MRDVVKYKSYLFAFKAFNGKLPSALNSLFIIKSGPYGIWDLQIILSELCNDNTIIIMVIVTSCKHTMLQV